MRASMKVNEAGLKRLMAQVEVLRKGEIAVKVGVVGPDANVTHDPRSGLTNAELAVFMEYGTKTVPARPAIRGTIDGNKDRYFKEILPKLARAVVEGKISFHEALDVFGLKVATDIKSAITSGEGIPPPLQPETVAAKGSDRPLVDTGRLLNSITHAVEVPK